MSGQLTVFISYSRESTAHVEWVRRLADAIEEFPEFHVVFDQYDLHGGRDLTAFMENGLKCHCIVAVVTPEYVRKAEDRLGGVGYESGVISAELLSNQLSEKFVPVLRFGSARPAFLRSKVYVDFRDPADFKTALKELRFALLGKSEARRPAKRSNLPPSLPLTPQRASRKQHHGPVQLSSEADNPGYTFESFIVTSDNRVAVTAARAVAASPGHLYNPLFIYGRTGAGKSHLLHAISNDLQNQHPQFQVLRLSTEVFVTRFLAAIRSDQMRDFRLSLNRTDALLLDDLGFLAGKVRTQEELFYRVEELVNRNIQVVVTSDIPLGEMTALQDRLRSEFESGLIVEVGYLDLTGRIELVRRATLGRGLKLDDRLLRFVAESAANGSPRELQSMVSRIAAEVAIAPGAANEEGVRRIIGKLMPTRRNVTPREIVRAVAEYYGIKGSDLMSRSNVKTIAFPRQVAFYLVKANTDLSYPEIGKLFGDKHHSTVMYSCNQIAEKAKTDPMFAESLRTLEGKIAQ